MKLILRLLVLCLSLNAIAQEDGFAIKKSEVFNSERSVYDKILFSLPDKNGGMYLGRRNRKRKIFVQHYDRDLKLTKSGSSKVNYGIETVFLQGDELHIIANKIHKKTDDLEFYVLKVDLNTFEFVSEEILHSLKDAEINTRRTHGFKTTGTQDKDFYGTVLLSDNKKYIGFMVDMENLEQETHHLRVYSTKDYEPLYDQEFKVDLPDNHFRFADFIMDDKGSTHVLARLGPPEEEKEETEKLFTYQLFELSGDAKTIWTIDPKEKRLDDLKLSIQGDEVVAFGFYTEGDKDKERRRFKGSVFLSSKSDAAVFSPFSANIMTQLYGEKLKKNLNSNLIIKQIYRTDEGNYIVISEDYFEDHYSMPDSSGRTVGYTDYHYRDILYAVFDATGQLTLATSIGKNQQSKSSTEHNSTVCLFKNNQATMFFPASQKVDEKSGEKISFESASKSNAILYQVSVSHDGQWTHKKIYNFNNADLKFDLYRGYGISNGVFVIHERKKKRQFFNFSL